MDFNKQDKERLYLLIMDILEDLEKCQKLKQIIEWL